MPPINKSGKELQPAAPLLICLSHLEPGVLPEEPKLVCATAVVKWKPFFIEWHEIDGKTFGGRGADMLRRSPMNGGFEVLDGLKGISGSLGFAKQLVLCQDS